MKKEKDHALTLIFCIVFFAVIASMPTCYQPQEHKLQGEQPEPTRPAQLIRAIKTPYTCPDCGEYGCIYEEIDDCTEGETDQDIENAIQYVCKRRGITDPETIDLIRANYYL